MNNMTALVERLMLAHETVPEHVSRSARLHLIDALGVVPREVVNAF